MFNGIGSKHRDEPAAMVADNEGKAILGTVVKWAKRGTSYYGVDETCDILPAGEYLLRLAKTENGPMPYFDKTPNLSTDELLMFPDSACEKIVNEFRKFWVLKEEFTKRKFLYKRGFLLYGPPGSGKTSAIRQISKIIIEEHNGVVGFVEAPSAASDCLALLRKLEPTRPIVCIMEDLDSLAHDYGESGFLSMLDGENTIDNVLFVGTTNYPERLDKRFVDRPSRFDTVMFCGTPNTEARRLYFITKEPNLDPDELDRWVRRSEGLSMAHLKEIIVATKCFGQSEDEVFARLEEMKTNLSSDHLSGRIGFGSLKDE